MNILRFANFFAKKCKKNYAGQKLATEVTSTGQKNAPLMRRVREEVVVLSATVSMFLVHIAEAALKFGKELHQFLKSRCIGVMDIL